MREKRKTLSKLEEEIRTLKRQRSETKRVDTLNSLTMNGTNKAEAALARTIYHYYEYGNKTGKLLAWQI